ncbi:hypothetical protein QJS04_geneDACA010554 [Acorus gramineus]|uniref:Uncharacterized protein n=1 Tax=Acorus gramineus TaxID=55184 RepID=A0AAV9AMD4_ACOGR|nr:hypothetical protein QJS04_geneDACA010554 [Acorus gramineus]
MVTTLGSGDCGGSVYVQDFSESLNFTGGASLFLRTRRIASLDRTIWTADCHNNGTHAVVGTNIGAALVNLETGGTSWVYHSKSDIFSQQFVQSGNVVLCGHRNGAIVPVDIRQRQSSYLMKGDVDPSSSFRMSSSVCSLVSLQSDDQYFIGSSMDGYINLYDLRLQKGAVQSYRGHMNSHTHLQLGVDPSETFIMSGGEDFGVRIWNIKTGKLLFGELLTSVPTTVCWPLSFSSEEYQDSSNKGHTLRSAHLI